MTVRKSILGWTLCRNVLYARPWLYRVRFFPNSRVSLHGHAAKRVADPDQVSGAEVDLSASRPACCEKAMRSNSVLLASDLWQTN